MGCPEENEILDFVHGQLPSERSAAIESHLDACARCLDLVSALVELDSGLRAPSGEVTELGSRVPSSRIHGAGSGRTPAGESEQAPLVERGVTLGRYVVLQPVGSGGMGVVYAAYDPELDRKIAVKVLRDVGEVHRQRMLREGRAMARLSHPNVITVHDVGTVEGRPYVAMEFVDGETLASWQVDEPKPWRRVLELYLAAGEGLAAAHAAGLVHRDFKPANVLVGRDGRVRVTDFGLARPERDKTEQAAPDSIVSTEAAVTLSLTRTGAIVGTPAYMSPEQYDLRTADARSDQFSFCVALFEGLYGHRPYQGRSMAELAAHISRGAIRMPEDHRGVPRRILDTLRRGLSVQPDDRFPGMTELLAQLRRDPAASWRRLAVVATPVVVLGTGVAMLALRDDAPCRDARARLGEAWDDSRREQARSAFAAATSAFSSDAWASVSLALDEHAAAWIAGWTDACEATHVRHEQSEQLLDLRMLCLSERRAQLSALSGVLAEADEAVVTRAVDAVHALPSADGCADIEALTAPVPPPADPTVLARVRELQAELARADVLHSATGAFQESGRIARAVADEAANLGYAPLQARALHRLATVVEPAQAQDAWTRTFDVALAARDDRVAARCAIELFALAADDPRREAEASAWLQVSESLARRLDDEEITIRLLEKRALRAGRRGEHDEGLQLAREVVRRVEALEGPGHPRLAVALGNLGQVLQHAGDLHAALVAQRRALAIDETTRGSEHPDVSFSLNNVAAVHIAKGEYREAIPLLERAVGIRERAFGPEHPRLLSALQNLAESLRGVGRFDEAEALFRRALAIAEARSGGDDPQRARLLSDLGSTAYYRGDAETARELYERALTIHVEHDPAAIMTAVARYNLGEALEALDRLDEAFEQHQQALLDMQAKLGESHPYVAYPRGGLGRTHLRRGENEAAIPLLEQALAQHEDASAPPRERAVVRLALAQAMQRAGQLDRAQALAEVARAEAEDAGALAANLHEQAERLVATLASR